MALNFTKFHMCANHRFKKKDNVDSKGTPEPKIILQFTCLKTIDSNE